MAADLRLREAEAHERAARTSQTTADLYRDLIENAAAQKDRYVSRGRQRASAKGGRVATDAAPDDVAGRLIVDEATAITTARELVATMENTAKVLEHTAALAEQEATRRTAQGRDGAEEERRASTRARDAAQRARAHAEKWRRYLKEKGA